MSEKKEVEPQSPLRPPDVGYLTALYLEKRHEFQNDENELRRLRANRTQTQVVPIPDEARLTDFEERDATIGDEFLRVTAAMGLNDFALQVTPARPGDAGDENATLREKWSEGVLLEAGRRPDGGHTYRNAIDACCEGGAWTKLFFDQDSWNERYGIELLDEDDDGYADYDKKTEDAKKIDGVPFVWESVDTMNIYPVWRAGKLAEVLEVTRRPLSQTLREYRLKVDQSGALVPDEIGLQVENLQPLTPTNTPYTILQYEHWDSVWVTYMIEARQIAGGDDTIGDARAGGQQIIAQWKHGYTRPPYFYAPGFQLNWQRGRKIGLSIAQTKLADCEAISFYKTLHAQTAVRDAIPPLFRRLPEGATPLMGQDGMPLAKETWKIREIINGEPGEELLAVPMPQVGPQLLKQIEMKEMAIERKTTPRVQANLPGGLEGAGFALAQVLAEITTNQRPIVQNLEQMIADVTRFLWKLVRIKVQEKVYVRGAGATGWLGAGPDDLTDTVAVECHVNVDRQAARLMEERYWGERLQQGTAHLDQVITALGDNPDEIRAGRMLDEIRQGPEFKKLFASTVWQMVGRGDLVAKAEAMSQMAGQLQQMQQQQQAMAQANPGIPQQAGQPGMPTDPGNQSLAPNGSGVQPVSGASLSGPTPPMSQQPGVMGLGQA